MFITFHASDIVDKYQVYVNGSWFTEVVSGGSNATRQCANGTLIEIRGGKINYYYNDDLVEIAFFPLSINVPWIRVPYDPKYGASFIVDDSYNSSGHISFTGEKLPTQEIHFRSFGVQRVEFYLEELFYTSREISDNLDNFNDQEYTSGLINTIGHDGYLPPNYPWISIGHLPKTRKITVKIGHMLKRHTSVANSYRLRYYMDGSSFTPNFEGSQPWYSLPIYPIPSPDWEDEYSFTLDSNYAGIEIYCDRPKQVGFGQISLNTANLGFSGYYVYGKVYVDGFYGNRNYVHFGFGMDPPRGAVVEDDLIEFVPSSIDAGYDPLSVHLHLYYPPVLESGHIHYEEWYDQPFDTANGAAFICSGNDSYAYAFSAEKKQPPRPDEDRVTFHIRRNQSINRALIAIGEDQTQRSLINTDNVFYEYSGTEIEFTELGITYGFDVPYILRFYENADYNPNEITLTQRYITGLILPQYTVNENTLYAEIAASVSPFTWYGTDAADMLYIQAGNLFTENFSAEMWNNYRKKLAFVANAYGINYNYLDVYPDDIFYGMGIPGYSRDDFSDVVDTLQLLPNSQMTIGHKGKGATVYASYFQDHPDTDWRHGNSIKKALNDVIHYYNGET